MLYHRVHRLLRVRVTTTGSSGIIVRNTYTDSRHQTVNTQKGTSRIDVAIWRRDAQL